MTHLVFKWKLLGTAAHTFVTAYTDIRIHVKPHDSHRSLVGADTSNQYVPHHNVEVCTSGISSDVLLVTMNDIVIHHYIRRSDTYRKVCSIDYSCIHGLSMETMEGDVKFQAVNTVSYSNINGIVTILVLTCISYRMHKTLMCGSLATL